MGHALPSRTLPGQIDVALLTIIPEAYSAVLAVLGLNWFEPRAGYEWALGLVEAKGGQISVVAGLALDRENIAAATFTDALLDAWCPRHLLLVDIGGAVKGRDNVQLGDVVTHTHLHYYDFKKDSSDGKPSPRFLPHAAPSTRLREFSRRPGLRSDNSWIQRIHVPRPRKGTPKVLPGEMLVGGTLFANSPQLLQLLDEYPKVVAVEMEGIGVARGILDRTVRGEAPEFLIIRGMSDFCNVPPTENQISRDRWKNYAAGSAAAHALSLIGEMPPPPHPMGLISRRFPQRDKPLDNLWETTLVELTGREEEIQRLTGIFNGAPLNGGDTLRHSICGEAGMGKSALARQLMERVENQYQLRWWINAADELGIRSGLRDLARCLGIPSAHLENDAEFEDSQTETHRYLGDLRLFLNSDLLGGRGLIVLDNVDDPEVKHRLETTALRYLPPHIIDVLITSQSSRWFPITETTHLTGLKPDIGAKLIASESGRPELSRNPESQEISIMFGGRPLFLRQVASLLHDGDDPAIFRASLARGPEQALDALPGIEGFDPLWRTTYSMAVDRAEQSRPRARETLEVLSCWSAEPIPPSLISAFHNPASNHSSIEAVLQTLFDRSLIEKQSDAGVRGYSIHRVVAALIRTLARERNTLTRALSRAAAITLQAIPTRRERFRHPESQQSMTSLVPHIWSLLNHTQHYLYLDLSIETIRDASECASMLGLHLWTMSEWSALERAYGISIELSEQIGDKESAAIKTLRLANVARQRGQFHKAETMIYKTLPLLRSATDPYDYAWSLTVEARLLRHRPDSDPELALLRLKDALSILESSDRSGELDNIQRRSELHNYISVLHRELSNLREAEKESIKGLRLIVGDKLDTDELIKMADSHLLATHLRSLGGVWRLRGEFQRAIRAHHRAVEVFERVYRRDHRDTYRALDSLGRAQREWGDLTAALESFKRAGEISEKLLGIDHAHTGTAAVNRALVHLELDQPEYAYAEAAHGLSVYRLAYNEPEDNAKLQNAATVWAVFVQANALAALNELDLAVQNHEYVLDWRLARQRPGHAHQASSYFALADTILLRDSKNSLDQVLRYHHQAFSIRRNVFGLAPNYWLAQSQFRIGQLTNDLVLLRSAHEYFSKNLRPGHWRARAAALAIEAIDH